MTDIRTPSARMLVRARVHFSELACSSLNAHVCMNTLTHVQPCTHSLSCTFIHNHAHPCTPTHQRTHACSGEFQVGMCTEGGGDLALRGRGRAVAEEKTSSRTHALTRVWWIRCEWHYARSYMRRQIRYVVCYALAYALSLNKAFIEPA
jgi:hypothetical protein